MDMSRLKVLVVDDMSSMRMMIKAILREIGVVAISEAGDGEKAIERLGHGAFDMVICDWDMPKATGLDVLRQVRGEATTASLPFIMLTANAGRAYVTDAIEAGVSDYLAKPFKPDDLIHKIQRVLRA